MVIDMDYNNMIYRKTMDNFCKKNNITKIYANELDFAFGYRVVIDRFFIVRTYDKFITLFSKCITNYDDLFVCIDLFHYSYYFLWPYTSEAFGTIKVNCNTCKNGIGKLRNFLNTLSDYNIRYGLI